MSESSGSDKEGNTLRRLSKDNDGSGFSCFGEYGSRVACPNCPNRFTCKNFTHEKQDSIYRKYKSKHKGRGKWTRKDLY